jgi:hypothetical protein
LNVRIEPPSQDVADYMRVSGAGAIYIAATTWGMWLMDATDDLATAAHDRHQEHFEIEWIVWVRTLQKAKSLALLAGQERSWWIAERTTSDAVTLLYALAKAADVVLTEHGIAMTRAQQGVRLINETLNEIKYGGQMASFNDAYKEYRRAERAKGRKALDYSKIETRLRVLIARVVIAGGKPKTDELLRILRQEFPWLNRRNVSA